MASYKKYCIHCETLIDPDSRFCVKCGSRSPFAIRCPTCLREVFQEDKLCTGCGRSLSVQCPQCGQDTFVFDQCQKCGASLMVNCSNRRCGEAVFFQNTHCTACGKKIRK
jgi:RNA polymerase subunit RPABC4/transcription elongation factor Spt4